MKINRLLDKLNNLELDKKKMMLLIFGLVLIIYFDFSFLIKLQAALSKKIGSKVAKITQEINKTKKDLLAMQSQKNKQPNLQLKTLSKKLISEEEVGSLLNEISDTANKNNIKIVQIKPNRQSAVQDKKAALKQPSIGINLELIANYYSLEAFINNLENAQNFIAVKGLKITRTEKDPFNENVSLELQTYVKK